MESIFQIPLENESNANIQDNPSSQKYKTQSDNIILNKIEIDIKEDLKDLSHNKEHKAEIFYDSKLCDYLNESLIEALDASIISEDENSTSNCSEYVSKLDPLNAPVFIPKKLLKKIKKQNQKKNMLENKYDNIDSNIIVSNIGNGIKMKFPSKIKEGDWICLFCNNVNFSFRPKCYRCGLLRKASLKMLKRMNYSQYLSIGNYKKNFNN